MACCLHKFCLRALISSWYFQPGEFLPFWIDFIMLKLDAMISLRTRMNKLLSLSIFQSFFSIFTLCRNWFDYSTEMRKFEEALTTISENCCDYLFWFFCCNMQCRIAVAALHRIFPVIYRHRQLNFPCRGKPFCNIFPLPLPEETKWCDVWHSKFIVNTSALV